MPFPLLATEEDSTHKAADNHILHENVLNASSLQSSTSLNYSRFSTVQHSHLQSRHPTSLGLGLFQRAVNKHILKGSNMQTLIFNTSFYYTPRPFH